MKHIGKRLKTCFNKMTENKLIKIYLLGSICSIVCYYSIVYNIKMYLVLFLAPLFLLHKYKEPYTRILVSLCCWFVFNLYLFTSTQALVAPDKLTNFIANINSVIIETINLYIYTYCFYEIYKLNDKYIADKIKNAPMQIIFVVALFSSLSYITMMPNLTTPLWNVSLYAVIGLFLYIYLLMKAAPQTMCIYINFSISLVYIIGFISIVILIYLRNRLEGCPENCVRPFCAAGLLGLCYFQITTISTIFFYKLPKEVFQNKINKRYMYIFAAFICVAMYVSRQLLIKR